MRVALVVVALLVGVGLAAVAAWPQPESEAYRPAPPLTGDEPLPVDSVVVEVSAATGLVTAVPGTVIEATYVGRAQEGHAPCGTLQRRQGGRWVVTHLLTPAWPGAVPGATFGSATSDRPQEADSEGRLWTADGFQIVCPAMAMTGAGPERFRLPLDLDVGHVRICPDLGWDICIPIEIVAA